MTKRKRGQQSEEPMALVHKLCGSHVTALKGGKYHCPNCGIISRGIAHRPASLVHPTVEDIQKELEEEMHNNG